MEWRKEVRRLRRTGIKYTKIFNQLKDKYDITSSMVRREAEKAFLPEYVNEADGEQLATEFEEIKHNKDKSITLTKNLEFEKHSDLGDPDFLLNAFGYDSGVWELISSKNNLRYTELKGGFKRIISSTTIIVKLRAKEERTDWLEKVIGNINPFVIKKQKIKNNGEPYMLEVPILDLHIGKLAWGEESGKDYDSKIASRYCLTAVDDVLNEFKDKNIEEVVLQIGQDLINTEGDTSATSRGTAQDTDARYQKVFATALQLMILVIERFRETGANIKLYYVPGNHSESTEFYLSKCLEAQYSATPSVKIDVKPTHRKYHCYGKCLIGMAHWESEKGRIKFAMQQEVPHMWASTKFREWHTGHLHSEHCEEFVGFKIRRLPALTNPDAWHTKSAYMGSLQSLQVFLWHKSKGLRYNFFSHQTED